MHYKSWIKLLAAALALNVMTFSFADESVTDTEEVESTIESPAEQEDVTPPGTGEAEDQAAQTEEAAKSALKQAPKKLPGKPQS